MVDVGRGGLHAGRRGQQVTDPFEERAIGCGVGDGARVGTVPGVEFALQAVAFGEQGAILRAEVMNDGVEAFPERIDIDTGARQGFLFDERDQIVCDRQAATLGSGSHDAVLEFENQVDAISSSDLAETPTRLA